MSQLLLDLAARMRDSLQHKSVVTASRWATQYRVMPTAVCPTAKWSFYRHPWLKEIHDCTSEYMVAKKSAQMGFSEAALNKCFYTLDILKKNVMYILPNQRPDATDFTTRAFNPAIEASEYLTSKFTGTNNTGHKTLDAANLYVRGSNSRSSLKSVPVSGLIFDEFEEHDRELTKLAEQRNSGQDYRFDWKISTPTIGGKCIDLAYDSSTKEEFYFPCPGCSKHVLLDFANVTIPTDDPQSERVLESTLHCPACKRILDHREKPDAFAKGTWQASHPGRLTRGFHISQLYSTVLPVHKVAKLYLESLSDPLAEQEFHNSSLGLAHTPGGAKLDDEILGALIKGFAMSDAATTGNVITMGVDVGRVLHVEITIWDLSRTSTLDVNEGARARVIWAGEVEDFEKLAAYMVNYNVNFCVVDAMPETREATRFANRFFGRVRLCRYNANATSRSIFASENDLFVSVNRTSWLDQSLGRFRNASIYLPNNLPRDYLRHMKAPARVPKKDKNGNTVYRYEVPDSSQDHFAHARNYSEIALAFVGGAKVHKDLTNDY